MQATITIPPNNAQNRRKHLDGGKKKPKRRAKGLQLLLWRNLTKTASKCGKNESEKEREEETQ
jgi:macrodomain Ter protein organizer (MatP/YcbG family)